MAGKGKKQRVWLVLLKRALHLVPRGLCSSIVVEIKERNHLSRKPDWKVFLRSLLRFLFGSSPVLAAATQYYSLKNAKRRWNLNYSKSFRGIFSPPRHVFFLFHAFHLLRSHAQILILFAMYKSILSKKILYHDQCDRRYTIRIFRLWNFVGAKYNSPFH